MANLIEGSTGASLEILIYSRDGTHLVYEKDNAPSIVMCNETGKMKAIRADQTDGT